PGKHVEDQLVLPGLFSEALSLCREADGKIGAGKIDREPVAMLHDLGPGRIGPRKHHILTGAELPRDLACREEYGMQRWPGGKDRSRSHRIVFLHNCDSAYQFVAGEHCTARLLSKRVT